MSKGLFEILWGVVQRANFSHAGSDLTKKVLVFLSQR